METKIETNLASLKLLTSTEVADLLRLHPQVVARKLQSGELEGYKIGKDWRVSEAQVFRFLEKHSNQNESESSQEKVLKNFFVNGKLKSIPVSRAKREVILRFLVEKLDPKRVYSESEINDFVKVYHPDVCTIRREFIMNKLMVRKDGKYKVSSWNVGVK